MKVQNYKKLQDIEKFYYKKKKIEYYKLMKKRRKRTYLIFLILIVGVGSFVSYKYILNNEYSNYLKVYGNSDKVSNRELNKELDKFKNEISVSKIDYKWEGSVESGNNPEVLVIHHSVSRGATPEDIHKWHKDKGYGGIGYHYYIKSDGSIFKGRENDTIGAHAYNNNRKTLAICLDGNFQEDVLKGNQKQSLVDLATSLVVTYNLKDIVGHRDCNETACPGKNIDIEELKREVLDNINSKRE